MVRHVARGTSGPLPHRALRTYHLRPLQLCPKAAHTEITTRSNSQRQRRQHILLPATPHRCLQRRRRSIRPPFRDTRRRQKRNPPPLCTNADRMHLPYSNPPRLTVAGHTVVDIRVAGHDYDSSSIYPDPSDSSDGDTPHYWLETTNPTPPTSNLPPPVMITDRQLMEWIESQLLWNVPICTNMQLPMPTHSTPYTYIRLLAAQRFILIKLPHHPTSNHPKTLPQYAAYPQRPPQNLPPSTLHDLQLRRVLGPTRCRHPDLKVAQTLPHLRPQRQ